MSSTLHLQHCRLALGPDATFRIDDFHVPQGGRIAVTGPSGCGKSTLLNIISGLIPVDDGTADVLGQPLHSLSARARDRFRGSEIGFVYQTFNLLPHFSALDNVRIGLHFGRGIPKAQRNARARDVIKAVGLEHRAKTPAARLSTGERQRVAIARAIANRPRLLLADEPTGSLDPENGRNVFALLQSICDEINSTLILVTHDLDLAAQLPDRFDARGLVT